MILLFLYKKLLRNKNTQKAINSWFGWNDFMHNLIDQSTKKRGLLFVFFLLPFNTSVASFCDSFLTPAPSFHKNESKKEATCDYIDWLLMIVLLIVSPLSLVREEKKCLTHFLKGELSGADFDFATFVFTEKTCLKRGLFCITTSRIIGSQLTF